MTTSIGACSVCGGLAAHWGPLCPASPNYEGWLIRLRKAFAEGIKLMRHVLRDRCRWHENYSLRWYGRWFYTAKALYCIAVGRHWRESYGDTYQDIDYVASWGHHSVYSMDCSDAYAWDFMSVGRGVFRRWFYTWESDSNC